MRKEHEYSAWGFSSHFCLGDTTQKMKFSNQDFFRKYDQYPQFHVDFSFHLLIRS